MEVQELKFLLELLGFPDYRAPISRIKPNPKTKAIERDAICRALGDRELVGYCEEVLHFSIASAGKSLLQLDTSRLPIAAEELQVLQACADSAITPAQTGLEADTRQEVIQRLVEKGLIEADKTQIKEVWLTPRGQEHLRDEYNPSGTVPVISLDLLRNYVRFMRKSLRGVGERSQELLSTTPMDVVVVEAISPESATIAGATVEPDGVSLQDEDIVRIIQELDRELGTDNYLPIFHLRQKLQPPLTREEVDRALYRLQRSDLIELSSLQEAIAYTPEQIEAGISQDIGGALFFIIVTK